MSKLQELLLCGQLQWTPIKVWLNKNHNCSDPVHPTPPLVILSRCFAVARKRTAIDESMTVQWQKQTEFYDHMY